jgi:hypothetical protein
MSQYHLLGKVQKKCATQNEEQNAGTAAAFCFSRCFVFHLFIFGRALGRALGADEETWIFVGAKPFVTFRALALVMFRAQWFIIVGKVFFDREIGDRRT